MALKCSMLFINSPKFEIGSSKMLNGVSGSEKLYLDWHLNHEQATDLILNCDRNMIVRVDTTAMVEDGGDSNAEMG